MNAVQLRNFPRDPGGPNRRSSRGGKLKDGSGKSAPSPGAPRRSTLCSAISSGELWPKPRRPQAMDTTSECWCGNGNSTLLKKPPAFDQLLFRQIAALARPPWIFFVNNAGLVQKTRFARPVVAPATRSGMPLSV